MKLLITSLLMIISLSSIAHDEGHGPALKDESLYGGKIAAIINEKEINSGRHAKMLYKAELLHDSRKLDVKVYLFDHHMKKIKLDTFDKKITAVQVEKTKEKPFELTLDESGNFYQGKRPKNKRVPFNIDVRIKKGNDTLFGAFDGLD